MNTNQLKKFAQETRRKLLKQVNGKLEHVLSSDNGALRDKIHVVQELKKDLDRFGREALVDKVAYTWFNRFVALRY
ncbi:MAG: restriction endonuclease, partial [Balneolaceae bacterium]